MTELKVQIDVAPTEAKICAIAHLPGMRELAECGEGCDGALCVSEKINKNPQSKTVLL
jgi:hypothetical protein